MLKKSDITLLGESVFTAPRNHYFIGWTTGNETYDANAQYRVADTGVTFTAQYEDLDNLTKAVAIFDYAGGTDTAGNGSQHKTGKANTVITGVTQPTREGYSFDKWMIGPEVRLGRLRDGVHRDMDDRNVQRDLRQ